LQQELSINICLSKCDFPGDCIITPWSDWKNCKSSGGNFEELRERFSTPPRNGGKSCPANLTLKESRRALSNLKIKSPINQNFLHQANVLLELCGCTMNSFLNFVSYFRRPFVNTSSSGSS